MQLSYKAEVERLHVFFSDWFADRGDQKFGEFAGAMAPSFYLVSTDGSLMPRDEIVGFVEQMRGSGEVAITIHNAVVHADDGETIVGTYEEHQVNRGIPSSRVSTAVMRRASDAPGGWLWLAVHETWIEPPAAAG